MSAPTFKLTAPASAALSKSLARVLAFSKVPEDTLALAAGDIFSVRLADGSIFLGVAPMLKVLSGFAPQPKLYGATAEERALVNQWVSLALQLSTKVATIEDAEPLVPKDQAFLAGTASASVADLLLYSTCADDVIAAGTKYPKLARWVTKAEADELVAPLKVVRTKHADPTTAAPAATAAAGVDGAAPATDGAAGGAAKPKFAIPTAEEIAAKKLQKEKEKAEKAKLKEAAAGPAAAAADAPAAEEPQLDIRVGKILTVTNHATAEKLYVETIDVGEAAPRTIVSGLVPYYKREELEGAQCLVVCNMKPKKLQGVDSNGMVLCAAGPEKLELVAPAAATAPGTSVVIGASAPAARPAIGKKTMDHLAALRTDDKGAVLWGDVPCSVNGVPLTSKFAGVPVK